MSRAIVAKVYWMSRFSMRRRTTTPIEALPPHHKRSPHCYYYFSSKGSDDSSSQDQHALFREQMLELQQEREELFGFTDEDHAAWGGAGQNHTHDASLMERIEEARQLAQSEAEMTGKEVESSDGIPESMSDSLATGLTHLTTDGSSVHMVDVGAKQITQRKAIAQSKVIFPPEVTRALLGNKNLSEKDDIVGPKGPVFATARIAGIMAAKKTSELIPLCHPLPLDQVNVNIRMQDDCTAVVECECRVTHKTGVEMEALTGASVAALCIYDMVNALSHQVRIEETVLLHKSGGKRAVDIKPISK